MATITALPHEILHAIFRSVDIPDLASLCITCRTLRQFVSDNHMLFRDLYLQRLDEPPLAKEGGDLDWEEELHKLVKLERILGYQNVAEKTPHLKFVDEVVKSFTSTANGSHSKNVALLTRLFNDRINKEAFFCQSTLWSRAKVPRRQSYSTTFEERQASAHLHCLYGVPILEPQRSSFSYPYPFACSIVYDLRNYTDGNFWGPFLDDGTAVVDWERLEAVMMVLGYNLKQFTQLTGGMFKPLWTVPFSGVSPESFFSLPLSNTAMPNPPANALDPYNVTGSYMRVICFLDFQELYHYNFPHNPGPGIPRRPLDTTEAIRFLVMELNVVDIQPPGEDDGQELPVVYFTGLSRLLEASSAPGTNTNSSIRGTVRLTKQGEVRWTTYSVYFGEERWKSEGIQVGGIGSARGVFGHWFDKNFSIEGPVGPSAFWKVTNEIGDMGGGLGDHMDGEGNENSDESYDEGQDVDDDSQDDEPFFGTIITISLS